MISNSVQYCQITWRDVVQYYAATKPNLSLVP